MSYFLSQLWLRHRGDPKIKKSIWKAHAVLLMERVEEALSRNRIQEREPKTVEELAFCLNREPWDLDKWFIGDYKTDTLSLYAIAYVLGIPVGKLLPEFPEVVERAIKKTMLADAIRKSEITEGEIEVYFKYCFGNEAAGEPNQSERRMIDNVTRILIPWTV